MNAESARLTDFIHLCGHAVVEFGSLSNLPSSVLIHFSDCHMIGFWEFVQKVTIFLRISAACGMALFFATLLFDGGGDGALASSIFGMAGVILGMVVALSIIGKYFD